MKGYIAFVAHCPEVQENQRVVVVGECPELGWWELGGAVCMRPAPCGRPWWVSSEVEVNLSEGTMGVSGGFAGGVETEGEVGMVRVSEVKFRLVAIPNDGEVAQTRNLSNLVCLEPLKGGDFRIVRLVGTSSPADCSSVGERGDNTIRVGVEGGGEEQTTGVVGISVEWGVAESVQLALLPRPTNRQTEDSQREIEHPCPPDSHSEIACLTSSQGGGQRELGVFGSTDEREGNSALSLCPCRSSVEVRGSGSERGTGVAEKSPIMKTQTKENEKHFDCSESVDDCTRPSADSDSENTIPTFQPSPSTHLLPHDSTHDRRRKEEGDRAQVIPLKRRRSESGLSQVEVDECDNLSGCHGERKRGRSRGEKQRRVNLSLSSDSAPLSSETYTGMDRGREIISGNDHRDEGGEVKRNRHGHILCLHGRVRYRCKECGGKGICEHGRIRSQCKDCGGASICEHGRIRFQCKECGGEGVCEHGRRRVQCKDCGGKGICEHGRRRVQCKDCGGKGICEHGRRRYECRDCGGKSVCEHGRQRNKCKECGGKSICEHGRERNYCKECGGASICEHGQQRYYCKDCGGKGICVHRKERRHCKECKLVASFPQ
uniref:CBM20 domain-containing protein n=1 Tax=Chromera velia CCMP2878 TaxID=1169474 RepID=A0A0G4FYU6_9ALVE|eukprot:Cvel_19464.t1-p1 / transcript=Cvel_19464.t1 / gene=Cvel_19464 / organism=Chromera_velia_CCMP2878 / gene_product=Zinc finger protein 283, putative / transcript_product=Zinc finger protein 283, putative / location=Cvel_scaffold1679:33372-35174(+) / protein_length=601 / sequence_SO=supercontig / SO=protein_coding / is_pseudo=false